MAIRRQSIRKASLALSAFLFLFGGTQAFAGNVSLAWDPSVSPNVVGYKVYYGNSSGAYKSTLMIGNQTTYIVTGLTNGNYYFAVTAFDGSGNESGYSNEVYQAIGTPSTDTTPPVISSVFSSGITSSSAIISWNTNEGSDDQVEYGTSTSYSFATAVNPAMGTSHSQALSGLAASTLYHYRVKSRDAAGNLATSGDYTFTTSAVSDARPVISLVFSFGITSSSAIISWNTDEASDTQVEYGTSASYGSATAVNQAMVTSHLQVLSGLTASTLYHYRVKSRDAAGNLATSGDYTLATPPDSTGTPAPVGDTTPPVISSVISSGITGSNATISWTTNEASDTQVDYGTSAAYGSSTTLNTSMTTAHSQQLAGLATSTLYHYRVKSRDAAGNVAVSGDYTFLTSAGPDTTPLVISSVSRLGMTSSGVTISWNTNKASDTQVDYGTSWTYGGSTLNSAMVTAHSQTLTGLTANTVYHFRVKSKDAAGNQAVSADYTFSTDPRSIPPVISDVTVSNITNKSATISWTTDEVSDSAVDYWSTDPNPTMAALSTLVTRHSLTLSNLNRQTLYHFRIKSADADGRQAVTPVFSFNTKRAGTSDFAFPRFENGADPLVSGDDVLMGIALANLGIDPAPLTFTAMDSTGNRVSGPAIVNPSVRQLNPGEQIPRTDVDFFGEGLLRGNTQGWVDLKSDSSTIGGFFVAFDRNLNRIDGANFLNAPLTDFAFTDIQPDGQTLIDIVNNSGADNEVTFDLIGADGAVLSSQSRIIKANGALVADLFGDVFKNLSPDPSRYIRMNAATGVQPFERMQKPEADFSLLTGQDLIVGATNLYSPVYATGGPYLTSLSIINLDPRDGTVTLRLVNDDGSQIGESKTLPIAAKGKIYVNSRNFFGDFNLENMTSGSVEIASDGVRLVGSTILGGYNGFRFSSALPLISKLQTSLLFSDIVSDDTYFTGLAILNPGSVDATAGIEIHNADGTLIQRIVETVPAGHRFSKLLPELFSSLQGRNQSTGYIMLISDQPVASVLLFGTNTLSATSAIPPYVVQ